MQSALFVVGNLLSDAAIGGFAFVVWWHENQDSRLRRIIALAITNSRLTSDQAALAESYAVIGDKKGLLQVVEGRLDDVYIAKLNSVRIAFSILRNLTLIVAAFFACGIALEAIAIII